LLGAICVFLLAAPLAAQVDVLTQHNDNFRTGANLKEALLNTTNVKSEFGKLAFRAVDGNVYAQPLVVSSAKIINRLTPTDVLVVATEHNSVYAFDAADVGADSTAAKIWQTGPEILGKSIDSTELYRAIGVPECVDLTTEVGITGTPVIQVTKPAAPRQGVIYVAAKSKRGNQYAYNLFALSLADGSKLDEITIEGAVSGRGVGSRGSGNSRLVRFIPMFELNRPALLLAGNILYVAFGSHCDHGPYHGWIFAYDVSNPRALRKIAVFCTTPNGSGTEFEGRGGIWMSGQGPAADEQGSVYVVTADGSNIRGSDFGDSVLKMRPAAGKLLVEDWYSPPNQKEMKENDIDFGSSGAVLLPGSPLLLAASKEGLMYVIDRNRMGKGALPPLQTIQVTHPPAPPNFYNIHASPAIWKRSGEAFVYISGEEDPVKQYRLVIDSASASGWKFDFHPFPFRTAEVSAPFPNFPQGEFANAARGPVWMPGGALSISANGETPGTGIVWVTMPFQSNANHNVVRGVLRALDASDISNKELWNSENVGAESDHLGFFAKYCPPTIANGKVYVPTFQEEIVDGDGVHQKAPGGLQAGVAIYGLRQAHTLESQHPSGGVRN
jgi:hypothetical protein